ncbi:hypothetical protein J2752_001745 [Halarchaeum rubridurum]|uniref:Uncharacterized protein n=1 Tax=Halarchaeum rubridurum TaxID=489911 RepID=A0A830FLZ6_9EURY|nr:hypothetical protein [Halarchaeum rubridurum]MBP1954833.1 hypothetical protein [Halarchaeum rubridurum]GGM60092.1 hypothetical protein GCM10009017_07830 [Halarchaeum rubridurum]
MADESGETAIDVAVADDRTTVTVTGTRDAAVIVVSASGERIYLPPEDFADAPRSESPSVASPYDGGRDAGAEPTAYGGGGDTGDGRSDASGRGESAYGGGSETSAYGGGGADADGGDGDTTDPHGPESDTRVLGVTSTPTGFRVVHPEPVHDVRVLGARD